MVIIIFVAMLLLSFAFSRKRITSPLYSTFSSLSFSGSNAIQKIYDSLKSIENNEYSSQNPFNCPQIQKSADLMNNITLKDLGLDEYKVVSRTYSHCMNVFCCDNFHLAVFILPSGAKIPLHDHPLMTVCSKLVQGELLVKSFTPLSTSNDDDNLTTTITARCELNEKLFSSKDKTWLLSPSFGNVHEFVAKSTCVIFDILLPPYKKNNCNYYSILTKKTIDKMIKNNNLKNINEKKEAEELFYLKKIPEIEISHYLPYLVEYNGIKPIV
jgi:hypothetical protein